MKETIAWECAHCGNRHLWKWDKGEAASITITTTVMQWCRKCRAETKGELARIGRDAWALTNPREA